MATVLIIEDDVEVRSAYAYTLGRHGFKVLLAANIEESLKLLGTHHPEVVILDLLMPGPSGLEFLRQYKVKHHLPNTKIIAFSNIDTPKIIAEAKKHGADEYVVKVNATPSQMVKLIEKLLASK